MRWVHLLLIGAAAMLAGCGAAAEYPDFTAKQYRLEGVRALPGASGRAVFFRDGQRLRYDGPLEGHGLASVVYDPVRKESYLLQTTASPRRRQFAGPEPRRLAIRLGAGETPHPLETSWAALGAENARNLGGCRVAGERGRLWRPRQPLARNVERTACITPDGIVLRLIENDVVLFEAVSVQRGPQPVSLFEIPETYQIIDDAELARADRLPSDG
jgi:hypothetical protein